MVNFKKELKRVSKRIGEQNPLEVLGTGKAVLEGAVRLAPGLSAELGLDSALLAGTELAAEALAVVGLTASGVGEIMAVVALADMMYNELKPDKKSKKKKEQVVNQEAVNMVQQSQDVNPLRTRPKKGTANEVPGGGHGYTTAEYNHGGTTSGAFVQNIEGPGTQATSSVNYEQVFSAMNTRLASTTQDMTWTNAFGFKVLATTPRIDAGPVSTGAGDAPASGGANAGAGSASSGSSAGGGGSSGGGSRSSNNKRKEPDTGFLGTSRFKLFGMGLR
jgi:hypothetical protein